MSILFAENFNLSSALPDITSYKGWVESGSVGYGSIGTNGPFGDNFFQVRADVQIAHPLPAPVTTTVTTGLRACASAPQSPPTSNILVALLSSGNNTQINVSLNTAGACVISRGSTTLASVIAPNPTAWNYYELQVTLSATAGVVILRQNSTVLVNLTGIDTLNDTANPNTAFIALGNPNSGVTDTLAMTHIYVTDNNAPNAGFLGDVRVYTQQPTADVSAAFTPTGLTPNYENAAKTPPAPTTDFNGSSTVGAEDLFSGAALPSTVTTIFAVGLEVLWDKQDSGARTVCGVISSAGTVATGAAITPVTTPSYAVQQDFFPTNPATAASWTPAQAAAAEFGYKIVS